MENQIKLVQVPVIEHKLKEAGQKVSERLAALDLDKQIATADTVRSLKSLRAELNKELNDFELQRKAIKEGVNNPYNAFEGIYKVEISEKYKNAIEGLKDKIAIVENKIKDDKEANLKVYFIELCQSEDIDFVTFDKLNIEVNLSTSEKKYKEQVNEFVQKVCSDIDLIKTMEFEAEIMAEYKRTLNASKAIQDIKERKEAEEKEKERIRIQELNRRKGEFMRIGMKYDEMTKTFVYNDNIYVSADKVRDISKEEFNKIFVKFEEKIKETKRVEVIEQKEPIKVDEIIEPQTKIKTTEPLKAPVVEENEEILTAEFRVKATYKQLMKLKAFLVYNNFNYENI